MPLPAHSPTDESRAEVQRLSGVGITQLQISMLLEMDVKTLTKYYRNDIDMGIAKSDSILAGALYKKAIEDEDLGAMIWLSKVRLRWKEAKDDTNVNVQGSVNITHEIVGVMPNAIKED